MIGSRIFRADGPHCQMAYFCKTSEMPKVARMVVSGSRPMSGRSVVIWSAAPNTAMVTAAMSRPSQKLAGAGDRGRTHEAAQHHEVAVGEVDHVHDPEDQGEAGGDQRQDHAVHEPVDGLDEDLVEGDGHCLDSEVLPDDRVVVAELGGGRVVAAPRPSP